MSTKTIPGNRSGGGTKATWQRWQATAFATVPADRERAESGIRAAYAAAGLTGPDRILWVPSPARGAIAAALVEADRDTVPALEKAGLIGFARPLLAELEGADAGRSVRDAVRTRPWEAARSAAHADSGPQEWARLWARTGAPLWDPVTGLVIRIRRGISDLGGEQAGPLLRAATLGAVLGQHDAPWLALFEELHGPGLGGPALGALAEVAQAAGWWWPYERLAIVAERPVELHRDEPGRLHRGDGPALAYPDGFALYAWRGMPTPANFIDMLAEATPERIASEENAELRRVMLEYYGYGSYLADVGARPVHRDETGVLWRIELPGDEPIVMVEVVNSTPEPDGTHRVYHLRVPPATRTAREGVAWTFGVKAADYQPQKET